MNLHDGLRWCVRMAMLAVALGVAAGVAAQTLSADDQYLWLVPNAANTEQQGFVRLINRGDAPLPVTLWGLDAAGVRSPGTVSLTLVPHESRQMNSQDLEFGNAGKGLTGALGSGSGDWTLVVRASLELEAMAYIRTPGGFLTSMHDRVRGDGSQWWVPMFNPANNPNQRSRLRIVNTEETAVDLRVEGIDDAGAVGIGALQLSLAGLSSIEFDAIELEQGNPARGLGGGLGDGEGKWQLQVSASGRISVQSLLSDPNGTLTNLSSRPDAAMTAPGERTLWLVPPAANVAQQGFVRLINREGRAGEVTLWGIDDAGQRSPGTIVLTLAPNESRQLNAGDLESGNPDKGLSGSLGSGSGNWRLLVMSDLALVPMAFIRTPDGFLTSIHDTVAGDGLDVEVPIFNPGENRNQVSLLRLVNANAVPAQVRIGGRDDVGAPAPGGEVTLTLSAGAGITLSAQELEQGAPERGAVGALGDGIGKWTLRVSANAPLRVMSLLDDPQGFLTNLSSAARGGNGSLEPLSVTDARQAAWRLQANIGPLLSELPAVTVGDFIYVGGGLTSISSSTRQFWRYDPRNDAWTRLADLPAARDHAMMAALAGKIYFFGGNSVPLRQPSRSTWRFDPDTASWAALPDMPAARAAAGAAALGDHIYVAGGGRDVIDRYTPATNTWASIPTIETLQRDHANVVAYRDEIWVLGGRLDGDNLASVLIYDPRSGTTRQGPRMREGRSGFAVAQIGGVLVAAGGESLVPPQLIASAEAYDPISGWQTIERLRVAVHGAGGAAHDGDFYLLTGSVIAGGILNPGRVQALDFAPP